MQPQQRSVDIYTMGKEKKGGKDKGDKGGDGAKLPPPPNLDSTRQGAHEAMLSFQIRGKEGMICEYEEEAEVFKERNYRQKERNHQLHQEQSGHYQTLVRHFKTDEEMSSRTAVVAKETVQKALREKLELARVISQELRVLELCIVEVDRQLEAGLAEVEKWQNYKNVIQHEKAEYIQSMRQQIAGMEREAAELEEELRADLEEARAKMEGRIEAVLEREKELISERLLQSLDRESQAEMADNGWMKKEIVTVKEKLKKLSRETDAQQLRNLKLMESMQQKQKEDLQATREIYKNSLKKKSRTFTGGANSTSETSLPSLVDVRKSASDEGPGGHMGQIELQLLTVEGARAPLAIPPETVHLPPLEEQRSTHTALPPRTSWPVTTNMLKSIV